jgi:antitoxin YefM
VHVHAAIRAQLSKLVEEAFAIHGGFGITQNGQRVAVLRGTDDRDALRETVAVLSDRKCLTTT